MEFSREAIYDLLGYISARVSGVSNYLGACVCVCALTDDANHGLEQQVTGR